jgi:hypothetical protein
MTIKCPYCECIEQSVIDRKQINIRRSKITYYCHSCKNEWSQMKGYQTIGRYYWHNGEHRRIPETATKIKMIGIGSIWE